MTLSRGTSVSCSVAYCEAKLVSHETRIHVEKPHIIRVSILCLPP